MNLLRRERPFIHPSQYDLKARCSVRTVTAPCGDAQEGGSIPGQRDRPASNYGDALCVKRVRADDECSFPDAVCRCAGCSTASATKRRKVTDELCMKQPQETEQRGGWVEGWGGGLNQTCRVSDQVSATRQLSGEIKVHFEYLSDIRVSK